MTKFGSPIFSSSGRGLLLLTGAAQTKQKGIKHSMLIPIAMVIMK